MSMSSTNTPSETHAHAAKANGHEDEHGPSLNAKAKKEKAQISLILRLLLCYNFVIAPIKDGIQPLTSVYLVAAKGWDAGRAGVILFVRDVSALAVQTFVGGFVDGSEHKRLLLILATFTAGLAASSIAFSQNFVFLIMKSIVEGVSICFITPCKCKNSLALGLIGPEKFDQVAKQNEVADHSGSFIIVVISGVVSYYLYPNNQGLFYAIGAGAMVACVSLMLMPLNIEDDDDNNTDSSLSSNHNDIEATAPAGGTSRPPSRPGLAKTKSIIDQKSSRNLVGDEAWP